MAVAEVQSGLEGVVAFATEIAEPDKEGGSLRYRGVDIDDLVGKVPFEKVWGLLVDGAFEPSRANPAKNCPESHDDGEDARPCSNTSNGRFSPDRRPAGTTATSCSERPTNRLRTVNRFTDAPCRSGPAELPTANPAAAAAIASPTSTFTAIRPV